MIPPSMVGKFSASFFMAKPSRLVKAISRYPRTLLMGTFFITLLFLWTIPRLELDPSLKSLLPDDHPILQTMDRVDELFVGSTIVLVAVESDSLLYRSTLEKFRDLQDSLEAIPQIGGVTSLYNATSISSSDLGFAVEPVLNTFPDSLTEVDSLQQKLAGYRQIVGTLISSDFRMMNFVCQLNTAMQFDEHALKEHLNRLVSEFSQPEDLYMAGLPILQADVTDQMQRDLKTFMPYGLTIMIVLLVLCFRSWLGVFLPLYVVIISIIWTFGLMAILNMDLPFTGILIPVMLIAIANDYGIHIIAHYYEYSRLEPEKSRLEIIRKTIRDLQTPILLAGLTTMVGFLSLLGHVLPRAQEMGLLVSFGILVAFFMSMILIPAALTISPRPTYLQGHASLQQINRFLHGWGRFFLRFNVQTIWILVIILLIAAWGIQYVQVDANPIHYYHENAPIRSDNDKINSTFGGSTQISVLVEGNMTDPQTLRNVEQLENHLAKNNLVAQTGSIVDIIKRMHRAFNGSDTDYEIIPDDPELIAQYLFLYTLTANAADLYPFVDHIEQPQHAQILVRLKKIKTMQIADLMEDTNDYIRANFYDQGAMNLTGPATLLGVLSRMIIRGQVISLLVSILIIFIVIAIVFRSLAAGILSVIPLGSAITILFGYMGIANIELTISTAMLSSILVGVGVDYTVHFLWHLRDHIRAGNDLEEAIFLTLKISGKGIVYNALSVIAGFSVLLLSVFLPVNMFGGLIILSITVCLVGALSILPAIISIFRPKFFFR